MDITLSLQESLSRLNYDSKNLANRKTPFYLASYKEIRRRGLEKAQNNLLLHLNELLQIMESDANLIDRDKRIGTLRKGMLKISQVDFEDHEFYLQHRRGYIRAVKRLCRESSHMVVNANLLAYKKYARIVDPSSFISYPILEVYECYKGVCCKIYQNRNPKRNQIFFLNYFQTKASKHIQARGGSPFSYLIIPEIITDENTKIFIQTGGRAGALAGGGNTQFLIKDTHQLIMGPSYTDWMS